MATVGQVGPVGVQMASVTLTSAQVLAIFTTPVTIVPAPGAGLMIAPIYAVYNYHYGGTAYTDGGGALVLSIAAAGFSSASLTTAGFWDQAASKVAIVDWTHAVFNATVNNQALFVEQTTANPTVGNGTVTVTVAYIVVPVT